MADDRSNKVQLFEGKDFGLWKRRVKIALRQKRALIAIEKVEGDTAKPTQIQENEAQHLIFNSLGTEVAKKVLSCTTAEEIWLRLLQIYENADRENVDQMLETYYTYRKDERDDMSTHIGKVESLAGQLEDVGQTQTEQSIMSKLLGSLPEGYNSLKEAWRSVHPELKTRNNLIARLLKYDLSQTREKPKSEVALMTKGGQERPRFRDKSKMKCYSCGRIGHMARECRKRPEGKGYDRNQQRNYEKVGGPSLAMTVGQESLRSKWIVDSGASRHISCHREWFTTYRECSEELQVGNEEHVKAVGTGTVQVRCTVGTKKTTITLQNVLYIPEMSYNLFSTGKASQVCGAKVLLDERGCKIQVKGETVATGKIDSTNSITTLDAETITGVAMVVSTKRTIEEWHQALGHVDPKVISEMATSQCVDGFEIIEPTKSECTICPGGKGTRASHTKASSIEAKKVGDAVDLDLCGPVNEETLGGRKYLMLARDRYSSYSHISILKTKSEACSKLQEYIGLFEAESGHKIKRIYTDNGGEFISNNVKTLCNVEHIEVIYSAPYTPEQNGGAERNNRTILNMIRTMLVATNLPITLWGEAALTAVYVRNRVPKRGHKMTPFEMFIGRKPFLGHIVPFGTPVQTLITDRRLGKFDSRVEFGFIVGFTKRTNTYRVYIRDGNRIKVSSDVIFRGHQTSKLGVEIENPQFTVTYESSKPSSYEDVEDQEPSVFAQYMNRVQQRDGRLESPAGTDSEGADSTQLSNAQVSEESVTTPEFSTLSANENTGVIEGEPSFHEVTRQEVHEPPLSSTIAADTVPTIPQDRYSSIYMNPSQVEESPFQGRALTRTPPRRNATPSLSERGPGLIMRCSESAVNEVPQTYIEAIRRPEGKKWLSAVRTEIDALNKNNTWVMVDRPTNKSVLTTKWVFAEKRNSSGEIERWKARLVARGFQQREGVDYTETFAPVVRNASIRTLLALASADGQAVERFDVSTAFLNGQIDEEVFIDLPEGIEGDRTVKCLKLHKALYGLKQAPRVWNSTFDLTIKKLGFTPTGADPCVYINKKSGVMLAVYVDDGLVIGKKQYTCIQVIESLNKHFEIKQISDNMFLGMEIRRVNGGLHLCQSRYVMDILHKFNMAECQPENSPLVDSKILFEKEGQPTNAPYRAAIGSLLYLAQITRPDILYPTILLAKFCEHPLQAHWTAIKRIFKYLRGSIDKGLFFPGPRTSEITLQVFSDADWGGDLANRKSTTGIIILLCGSPVSFVSRQQGVVAQSSTEAEFIAASEASKELVWLQTLLSELQVKTVQPTMMIDNTSAMELIRNPDTKRRSKHIDIRYHFVRDLYKNKTFDLQHVSSTEQLADFLTKRMTGDRLELLGKTANIVSLTSLM